MNANNRINHNARRAGLARRLTVALGLVLLMLGLAGLVSAQSDVRYGSGESTQTMVGTIERISLSTGTVIVDGRAFGVADPRASNADYDAGPAHGARLGRQLSRLKAGDQVELSFLSVNNSSRIEGQLVSIRKVR